MKLSSWFKLQPNCTQVALLEGKPQPVGIGQQRQTHEEWVSMHIMAILTRGKVFREPSEIGDLPTWRKKQRRLRLPRVMRDEVQSLVLGGPQGTTNPNTRDTDVQSLSEDRNQTGDK